MALPTTTSAVIPDNPAPGRARYEAALKAAVNTLMAPITEDRTATSTGATTGTISAFDGPVKFVTVTSTGANDIIILPAPVVGQIVILHNGATGYELRTSAPATIAINAGTGTAAESAIAANSTCILICCSATAWKGVFWDADSDTSKIEAAAP